MASKLTKLAFKKLVEEDLEWLAKQPRNLEQQHVECIVRESSYWNYEVMDLLEEIHAKCDLGEELNTRLQAIIDENTIKGG